MATGGTRVRPLGQRLLAQTVGQPNLVVLAARAGARCVGDAWALRVVRVTAAAHPGTVLRRRGTPAGKAWRERVGSSEEVRP